MFGGLEFVIPKDEPSSITRKICYRKSKIFKLYKSILYFIYNKKKVKQNE